MMSLPPLRQCALVIKQIMESICTPVRRSCFLNTLFSSTWHNLSSMSLQHWLDSPAEVGAS